MEQQNDVNIFLQALDVALGGLARSHMYTQDAGPEVLPARAAGGLSEQHPELVAGVLSHHQLDLWAVFCRVTLARMAPLGYLLVLAVVPVALPGLPGQQMYSAGLMLLDKSEGANIDSLWMLGGPLRAVAGQGYDAGLLSVALHLEAQTCDLGRLDEVLGGLVAKLQPGTALSRNYTLNTVEHLRSFVVMDPSAEGLGALPEAVDAARRSQLQRMVGGGHPGSTLRAREELERIQAGFPAVPTALKAMLAELDPGRRPPPEAAPHAALGRLFAEADLIDAKDDLLARLLRRAQDRADQLELALWALATGTEAAWAAECHPHLHALYAFRRVADPALAIVELHLGMEGTARPAPDATPTEHFADRARRSRERRSRQELGMLGGERLLAGREAWLVLVCHIAALVWLHWPGAPVPRRASWRLLDERAGVVDLAAALVALRGERVRWRPARGVPRADAADPLARAVRYPRAFNALTRVAHRHAQRTPPALGVADVPLAVPADLHTPPLERALLAQEHRPRVPLERVSVALGPGVLRDLPADQTYLILDHGRWSLPPPWETEADALDTHAMRQLSPASDGDGVRAIFGDRAPRVAFLEPQARRRALGL